MINNLIQKFSIGITISTGLFSSGCGSSTPSSSGTTQHVEKKTSSPVTPSGDDAHGHKPGSHGGILVSLGRDSYHAEAVFEKNGIVRLYMLGKDEARVHEVDVQDLIAYLTPDGSTESDKLTLKPEPQPGDAKGKTSMFSATLPKEFVGKKVQVTINNINVNGERFRIAFTNERKDEHSGTEMPAKKSSAEADKLFGTPGGLYTVADIKANGIVPPGEKYKGIRAKHDTEPKSGDKICPITDTLANPKFTWVIGGKMYEFCCTPCIEEFVVLAKEKPSEVKDPKDYVKK